MTSSHRSWLLAGALMALGVGVSVAAGVLAYAGDLSGLGLGIYFALVLILPYLAMGALVIAHQPRHPIGWLLLLVGMFQSINLFSSAYGEYDGGSLPYARLVYAFGEVNWIPSLGILITLLPLLFPTGRPLTSRWRWVVWTSIAGMVLVVAGATATLWFQDTDLATGDATRSAPFALELIAILGAVLLIGSIPWAIASMVVRFRRSRGIERQQLKWFVCAVLINLALILYLFAPGPLFNDRLSEILSIAFPTLPIAVGIAILRYRLYEIDQLINRALVYGALTATLVGAYVVMVFGLQELLSSLTSGSDIAVAGSTLAVAALFRPIRERIQQTVDRRFYRRKYDAARTVDAFAARLRDEIDLDALTGELRAVVADAVQPSYVSLWLRPPQRTT